MKYWGIFFLFTLASCASSNSCLPLKTWSDHDQDIIEAQLDVLPPDSPLINAMLDYEKMRAETKACKLALEN